MCRKRSPLLLFTSIVVIKTIMGWFEITQYHDKKMIIIYNLVEAMGIIRYPFPVEITHDWVSELIGCEFKVHLFCRNMVLNTKQKPPIVPRLILSFKIYQVLDILVRKYNIQENYVDKYYPCEGIIAADSFWIISTQHKLKGKIPGQLFLVVTWYFQQIT